MKTSIPPQQLDLTEEGLTPPSPLVVPKFSGSQPGHTGTPSIVQQRRDNYQRLLNNPKAPSGLDRYAHEPQVVFDQRRNYMALADRMILDRGTRAPESPSSIATNLIRAATELNEDGYDPSQQPLLDAEQFFSPAAARSSLDVQAAALRQMGPEGQAAERLLTQQFRDWQQAFSVTLARSKQREYTEDEFVQLAQTTPGYHPALQGQVAQYLEANLPENLQKGRAENDELERKRNQIADEAIRLNAISIESALGQQRAEEYAAGKELTPDELNSLLAQGKVVLDKGGRPMQRDPRTIQDENRQTALRYQEEDQIRQDQRTEKKKETEQEKTAAAENRTAFSLAKVDPKAKDADTQMESRGYYKDFYSDDPSKFVWKKGTESPEAKARKDKLTDLDERQQKANLLERRVQQIDRNRPAPAEGETARSSMVMADQDGKPVLVTPGEIRDSEKKGFIPWDQHIIDERSATGFDRAAALEKLAPGSNTKPERVAYADALYSTTEPDLLYEAYVNMRKAEGLPVKDREEYISRIWRSDREALWEKGR